MIRWELQTGNRTQHLVIYCCMGAIATSTCVICGVIKKCRWYGETCSACYQRKGRPKKIFPTEAERFWSKVTKLNDASGGCWIWNGNVGTEGYGLFNRSGPNRSGPNRGSPVGAHRYSWELHFLKPSDRCVIVCHKCDNRLCVNPDHLFLGSQDDNMKDMIAKGRSSRGEKNPNPNSKLTLSDVEKIFVSTLSYSKLAKQFGVTKSTIGGIKTGRLWKKLPS